MESMRYFKLILPFLFFFPLIPHTILWFLPSPPPPPHQPSHQHKDSEKKKKHLLFLALMKIWLHVPRILREMEKVREDASSRSDETILISRKRRRKQIVLVSLLCSQTRDVYVSSFRIRFWDFQPWWSGRIKKFYLILSWIKKLDLRMRFLDYEFTREVILILARHEKDWMN